MRKRAPAVRRLRCDNEQSRFFGASRVGGAGEMGEFEGMLRALSTHIYLQHRLHPGLLEQAGRAGAQAVEIFAARQHFDYANLNDVRELGAWFRSNTLEPWSMHAPLYPDREMGRAGAPAVNVLHPEKSRRINAMDEIKRALETAEHIPYRNLILHLGERDDAWSQRTIEYAVTALEHLGAFSRPLGVRLLVENLTSDPTTPEHLKMILEMGRLTNIGVCLDVGHAHITVGVAQAIETLGAQIASVHVHDNHGMRDEHLWPGDGTIDWTATASALNSLKQPPAAVLEIHYTLGDAPADIPGKIERAFEKLA